jgi:hypothetical protein
MLTLASSPALQEVPHVTEISTIHQINTQDACAWLNETSQLNEGSATQTELQQIAQLIEQASKKFDGHVNVAQVDLNPGATDHCSGRLSNKEAIAQIMTMLQQMLQMTNGITRIIIPLEGDARIRFAFRDCDAQDFIPLKPILIGAEEYKIQTKDGAKFIVINFPSIEDTGFDIPSPHKTDLGDF